MLRDGARRFLAENCPSGMIRRMMAHETAHDQQLWHKLAELGWLGLLIPERYGGTGGGLLDMTVLLEETGRALMPGPFFTAALMGATLVTEGAGEEQRGQLAPRIADGSLIVTPAIAEMSGRFRPDAIQMRAERQDGGYLLTGEKMFVWDAQVAGMFAVAARTGAAHAPRDAIALFLVPAGASGLDITPLTTVDMTRRLCHLRFDHVPVAESSVLGELDRGWPVAERTLAVATAGLCAEMVGTAQHALDMAVEYAKTRVQFGKPIGSFQAVKHKCVDMLVAVENARSLTYYACWALSEGNVEAATAVAMAKAYASDIAKTVTSEAIQIHGGIGFTWEHDIHLFHRRALAGEGIFGNAPEHREAVARAFSL